MKPVNLTIKHISDDHKTALVESKKGNTFPVNVHPNVRFLIKPGYYGRVVKSAVTGEWIMIDYICQLRGA